ncbi:MAG: Fe-S cluster assembly protein SufD [Nitrospinaceae bacterium]
MEGTIAEARDQAVSAVLGLHKKFLEEGGSNPALTALWESAIQRFETLKFPHRKHEMYTFVNTKELAATPFDLQTENNIPGEFIQRHIYPGCEKSHLTLVDGIHRPELSDTSALDGALRIRTLGEAVSDPDIRDYLLHTIAEENDVFASINGAFFKQGMMIEVEPKSQVKNPLQILHVSGGSKSRLVMTRPRVLVKLGMLAELKMIVKFVGVRGNYFVNAVQDILVKEGAGVTFTQVQQDAPDAWHFSKARVEMEANSRFMAANASSGSKLTRHHYEVHLKEAGAELRLNGVSVLTDEEQVHNFIRIHHEAPHCTSNQHFKNIVNQRSRSSVDGTVVVNPGAQLTSSDQLINNLMLSDGAHADNKPNLMIFADDVKCTHGATIGQIDEDQMFYLKTRGLSQKIAKELLTKSFAESIIQTIEFPAVVEDLENFLLKKLEA